MRGNFFTLLRHRPCLLLLLLLLTLLGCLNKPYLPGKDLGCLSVSIQTAEVGGKASLEKKALVTDLAKILICLEHHTKDLRQEQSLAFTNSPIEATFSSLYPGLWKIVVFGQDRTGRTIFQGEAKTPVDPGGAHSATILLSPAPGHLNVNLDASMIPGFGIDFSSGRLYVYLNPESGSSTPFTLYPEGHLLRGEISLPEGTFQVRVVVPNISNKVFESDYYTVHIEAGQTSTLEIKPDSEVSIIGIIDSTPTTPERLAITAVEFDVESHNYLVSLSWLEVDDSDLAGYRLYRSNKEGRFVRIASLDKNSTYQDIVTRADFFHHRVGYAISSYDLNANESLWSDPVYLEEVEE